MGWVEAVAGTATNYRKAAEEPGYKYGHIATEKLAKITKACADLSNWLEEAKAKQEKMPKYEKPVLLCAEMEKKNQELARVADEILREPKPPPPPPSPKEEEEKLEKEGEDAEEEEEAEDAKGGDEAEDGKEEAKDGKAGDEAEDAKEEAKGGEGAEAAKKEAADEKANTDVGPKGAGAEDGSAAMNVD